MPADSFYEWEGPKERRRPVRIQLASKATFAFAGLWDCWTVPGEPGDTLFSCAIITTEANALVRPIHDRMPAILSPGDEASWLDPAADPRRATALLRPFPAGQLVLHRVSSKVSDARFKGPECLEREPAG